MTPEWLRDLLTELSGIAHGHTANQDSARRILLAVPLEHIHAAGLDTAAFGGVVEAIFGHAVDEEPVDRDHGVRLLPAHTVHPLDAYCWRSGECVLPGGHGGGCDWGQDEEDA